MQHKTYYTLITVFSIFAFLATLYLIYQHYAPTNGPTICDFGSFSCSTVNKSYFSSFFGSLYLDMIPRTIGFDIPYSVSGAITYLTLIFLGILGLNKHHLLHINKKVSTIIFILTIIGFIFSLYLTFVEAFILEAWCLFCVSQAILITLMLFFTIHHRKKHFSVASA